MKREKESKEKKKKKIKENERTWNSGNMNLVGHKGIRQEFTNHLDFVVN